MASVVGDLFRRNVPKLTSQPESEVISMQTMSLTFSASGSVSEADAEKLHKQAEELKKAAEAVGLHPTVEFASPVGTQQQQLDRKIEEDKQRRSGQMTPEQRILDQQRQEQIEKEKQHKQRQEQTERERR
jgi:pyruvate/2-oxoacid:ferredoxin oxidoreductase beta subunit